LENSKGGRIIDGRYALTEEVRTGGMSVVLKAYDLQEQRPCAIKRTKLAYDEMRGKESFNREHTALSELVSHRNIVSMYDAGVDEDGFYMVLEWVPHSLVGWIERRGAMQWPEFYAGIGRPVLDALAFSQGRNWSHRDIKPSNILITDAGVPKISDYGIAKQFEKPSLGATFITFRSAPFTPPEDDSEEWRCSRDCFSWAAVAVYCLTGKMPADYGELAALVSGLDRESSPVELLEGALSHTPNERPPLASAFLAELDAFEAQRTAGVEVASRCHLRIDAQCLARLMRTLDAADHRDVEKCLLDELNEVRPSLKAWHAPDGSAGLLVLAVTWTLEVTPDKNASGCFMVRRAWQSRPSEVERHRETGYRPVLAFTFDLPGDPVSATRALERLVIEVDAFAAEEHDRVLQARRERVFRLWYAFLRSKADFEARRENAISYIGVKINESKVALTTNLPAPQEIIGQSRVIRLPSSGHVFCDVIDVNLDEIVVNVTSGDLSRLPASGILELNTIAAEKAIERQRSSLDAVNYNRAASPQLKPIIIDPKSARPPVIVTVPVVGGGKFDTEKKEVLQRALGLQDVLAIRGPPGTGKTRLIEEIIVQYLDRHPRQRVLLSSQTHVALDTVIERVRDRQSSIDVVRIGRMDDPKIRASCRDLVLDRKAQVWSEGVRSRAQAYMTQWAQDRGIERSNIEIGMLAERLIRLLGGIRSLSDTVREADARARAVDERAERKLAETGSAASEEIEADAVEAQAAVGVARSAMAVLRNQVQEVRDRLLAAGGYGAELAGRTEEGELREWSAMLLGDSDDERRCRELLELQEDWILQVGRSSDFHAAMLASAQVVAGTCIGMAGVRGMGQVAYDLCIVDEASKATATEILVPMSRSRRWILVGDPEQLPPFFEDDSVTQIDDFADDEVRQTLFDRLLGSLPDHSVAELKNQHRMVRAIGDLISEAFYDGSLKSPKTKPDVTLPGAFPKPVTWLSTTDLPDVREIRRGASFRNDAECRIICDALAKIDFIARRRKAVYDIALIAGYVAQVKALQDAVRDRLHEWLGLRITCSTVDAFQGNEAEICIYSVTRSNLDGNLGFLREKPRLNVALSRGRSALIIAGDDEFCRSIVGANPFRKVLDYIDAHPDLCEGRPVQ